VFAVDANRRRIDEHAFLALESVAKADPIDAGTDRPVLVEDPAAACLHRSRHARVPGERCDALEEFLAAGNRVEHRARVLRLALHEGGPLTVLVVFHPAVRIDDRLAPERFGDRFNPRDRWPLYSGSVEPTNPSSARKVLAPHKPRSVKGRNIARQSHADSQSLISNRSSGRSQANSGQKSGQKPIVQQTDACHGTPVYCRTPAKA
jgi:hypothetical protein